MPYRVEIASQGRAGCKNKECKDAGIKILKGELRFGTLVTIMDHTTWTWKHWGCVTPVQIGNLQEESGGNTDMVDGFDELDGDSQQKVRDALANGHVDDEDWKGDVEVNRPGQKGFRVKVATPKKKKSQPNAEDDEEKPKKKRGRPAKTEDGDAAPAAKKPRAKKAKKAKDEDEDENSEPEVIPTKKARGKVVKKAETDAEVKPAAKSSKAKGKKTTANKEPDEEADGVDGEEEAPEPVKAKRGKKATDGGEKPKRGRKKKSAADEE